MNFFSPAHENLVDLALFYAQTIPEKEAFTILKNGEIESETLSYRELHEKAAAIAGFLQSLGLKGERALLVFPTGIDFITAFFGCLYAGVIGVPIYLPFSKREGVKDKLEAILANAQPKIVLTTKEFQSLFEKFQSESIITNKLDVIQTDSILSNRSAAQWEKEPISPDELAFLQYTSGSTNAPKGVMVSHRNVIHNAEMLKKVFQHSENTVLLSWMPHYHDMGLIGSLIQAFYVGGTAILMAPMAFLQQPIRWLKAISKYGAHTSGAPNFAYELCASQVTESEKLTLDLQSWSIAFNGAEPIRHATLERFSSAFASCGFRKEAFYPCYGLAESTVFVSGGEKLQSYATKVLDVKELEKNKVSPPKAGKGGSIFVSCGRTWFDTEMAIVNPETTILCKAGEVGEIWVKSQSIAKGYWMNPEASAETFGAHIGETQEGPFLRTGDLGFINEEKLYVTGRLKELMIFRGTNHYPQDIEESVQKAHPSFAPGTGAAFSVSIQEDEKLIIVQEILRTHLRKFDSEQAIASIRHVISKFHGIEVHAIVFIKPTTIPKTSSGKIQRLKTKQLFLANALKKVAEWEQQDSSLNKKPEQFKSIESSTAIYDLLIERLADKVHLPSAKFDIHLPFSFYGLDSAKAVSISGELEKIFQRSLPATLLYEYPTIETLAQFFIQTKRNRNKVDSHRELKNQEPIAVVGMGLRFPQANSPESLWSLLHNKVDAVTKAPSSRTGPGISSSEYWGGFLSSVDLFDADFFSISPREANHIDPQQRLLLEVCWEAIENANIVPSKLRGSETGVYIGLSSSDYGQLQLGNLSHISAYSVTGSASSIAANRLSYFLGLHGPSMAIDTACSSSLVSIHLACNALRQMEVDLALTGGSNLLLSSQLTSGLMQAGMLAKDGRCKTFDASADGYVRGEGCGVVVLKRLSDAIADKDCISAIILGSAVNQDGLSNGLTAPNGFSQRAVIQRALSRAGVAPEDISYVEAHGTGTALGDPIEVSALVDVLMPYRTTENPCWVGSIKTNMGHLEAAAGIAGLIKVALALKNKEIPANLHINTLNPYIRLDNVPLYIPKAAQPWSCTKEKRIAGVSSFGFGGTNAHLIMSEASKQFSFEETSSVEKIPEKRPVHLMVISGKGEEALLGNVKNFKDFIEPKQEAEVADICYTANVCRTHFTHRVALVAHNKIEIHHKLEQFLQGTMSPGVYSGDVSLCERPNIAFLFTGQGAQYVGMGSQLYETCSVFREVLDRCELFLKEQEGVSVLEMIQSHSRDGLTLDETIYAQPALFALEYALASLWSSYGIQPEWVMGHSLGEYVAACFAGVFTLEEGLKLVATRGRLMQGLSDRGKMVVVFASEERVLEEIANYSDAVSIAGLNSPEQVVISGKETALEIICDSLSKIGIKTHKLAVSHAFHSPLMEPMIKEFYEVANKVNYQVPKVKIISNTTGKLIDGAPTAEYWCQHLRNPIRFSDGVGTLGEKGCNVFIEIGPHSTLLGMGRACLPEASNLWVPSLKRGRSDWQQLTESLCELYARGASIDFEGVNKGCGRQKVDVPTYAFQHQRYWLESTSSENLHQQNQELIIREYFYELQWVIQDRDSGLIKDPNEVWIVFCDQQGIGLAFARALEKQQRKYVLVDEQCKDSSNYEALFSDETLRQANVKVLNLWHLDLLDNEKLSSSLFIKQVDVCKNVLDLLKVCLNKRAEFSSVKIWLVTQRAIAISREDNALSILQSSIWGLGKTVSLEHPEIWGGLIDLDRGLSELTAKSLLKEIDQNDFEDQVVLRKEGRYVPRLIHSDPIFKKKLEIKGDGAYLITGGLGALGLQISHWLIGKGARCLILVSRRGAYTEELQSQVNQLKQNGVTILVIKGDISVEEDVVRLFESIAHGLPPLKGVIHAAGISGDYLLIEKLDAVHLTSVFSAKVKGGWLLHQHTKDRELDFFVNFSSISSVFGAKGQGHYAASNQFLDALAHYRRALGLCGLSINWGPWADGGMVLPEWGERLARTGIELLQPQEGLTSLDFLLSTEAIQVAFVKMNWALFKEVYEVKSPRQLLSELTKPSRFVKEKQLPRNDHKLIEQLNKSSLLIREKILRDYLQMVVVKMMKFPPEKLPDCKKGFFQMGMDSIMALELVRKIEEDLEVKLPTTSVFDYPNIYTLSKYLATQVIPLATVESPKKNSLEDEPSLKPLKELSEQEAISLLLNKFEKIEKKDL